MHYKAKIGVLAIASVMLIAMFLFLNAGSNWDYILPRRSLKILAIVLTGASIAFSTIVFQTITNNRILTPSILGLDSLYMLIQTFIIFVFGSMNVTIINKNINFILSVGLMVLFMGVLYKILFKREEQNIYFLLLIGLILGTLFGSLSSFMQVLIDPNEFLIVQDKMFASFNNINTDVLILAVVANLAHEFLKTYRHTYLIVGSILISIVALIGGQLIVERVFTFSTTLSVIINFIGGVYFIYLLLKENKSW